MSGSPQHSKTYHSLLEMEHKRVSSNVYLTHFNIYENYSFVLLGKLQLVT